MIITIFVLEMEQFDFIMQSNFQKMQMGLQTVNSDQAALLRAVRSRSLLFAQTYLSRYTYSGTSVAQTLMTPLPQLFRTRS